MAMPMSAQQVMELQRKKNPVPKVAMPEQGKTMQARPPVAAPKPAIGGVVPSMSPKPLTPMVASPQAAQMKPKGAIPNMPMAAAPKNLIGTPGQAAKPTNLIGTPKPSVPTPMSAPQAQPKPSNVTPNGGYMPLSNNITDVRSGDQLNQLAADQLAMERAGLKNAADTQTASLQNSAKYANQLIQDNRVLEDGNFARTNAPAAWDGSVGYRGAMLDRGRQIDDTMRAADLANAMNGVQQELYNFDTNAAAKQRGIANELLTNERNYGIDVGNQAISKAQVTGEYFDPQAQSIANQIIGLKQQAEAPGITAQDRAALSTKANGLRSQLSNMGYDANQFGANVNSTKAQGNMSGLGVKTLGSRAQDTVDANQKLSETEVMASLTGTLPNGQKTTAEQQRQLTNEWYASEQTGVISDTLAQIYNIPKGTPTRAAKEWASEFTFDSWYKKQNVDQGWAANKISQQNANTSRMNVTDSQSGQEFDQKMDIWKATGVAPEGIIGVQPGTPFSAGAAAQAAQPTASDMRTYFDSMIQRDDKGMITNSTDLENSILNSELSDYDTYQLYLRYGLSWGGPVPTNPGK